MNPTILFSLESCMPPSSRLGIEPLNDSRRNTHRHTEIWYVMGDDGIRSNDAIAANPTREHGNVFTEPGAFANKHRALGNHELIHDWDTRIIESVTIIRDMHTISGQHFGTNLHMIYAGDMVKIANVRAITDDQLWSLIFIQLQSQQPRVFLNGYPGADVDVPCISKIQRLDDSRTRTYRAQKLAIKQLRFNQPIKTA